MPTKPKKPCSYPGCPELTDKTYCKKHASLVNKYYEEQKRPKDFRKRYSGAWPRVRNRFIKEHPLCFMCQEKGLLVPARLVHHIKPVAEGGTHDENNLMSLCWGCHERIHKRGVTGRGLFNFVN